AAVADGPGPHRWPGAQRGARRLRPPARRVLAAAGGGHPVVVKRSLLRLRVPLRRPFVTANGVLAERELVVIRLEDDEGTPGWGEAAPLEPYDGVSVDAVWAALTDGPPARDAPPHARTAWELSELD